MNTFVSVSATRRQPLSLKGALTSLQTSRGQDVLGRLAFDTAGSAAGAIDRLKLVLDAEDVVDGLRTLEAASAGLLRIQTLVIEAKGLLERAPGIPVGASSIRSRAIRNAAVPVTEHNLLGSGTATPARLSNAAHAAGPISETLLVSDLSPAIRAGDVLTVNGKTISFEPVAGNEISAWGATLNAKTATVRSILDAIEAISGGGASIDDAGYINLVSTTWAPMTLGGNVLVKLGFARNEATSLEAAPIGHTLKIGMSGGDTPVTIVFGDARNGTIKTLAQLNSTLLPRGLRASLDGSGRLTILTSGDRANDRIEWIDGTITLDGGAFEADGTTSDAIVVNGQAARPNPIARYNAILADIDATVVQSQVSDRNLLDGDDLSLFLNETGKSKLEITGICASSYALGLSPLAAGALSDPYSINDHVRRLDVADLMLRRHSLSFGSGLASVRTRRNLGASLVSLLGQTRLQGDIRAESDNLKVLQTAYSTAASEWFRTTEAACSTLRFLNRADGYFR